MEEFVTSFHSLSGTTIGERRKNLNFLLNRTECAEFDFSLLQPKTALEENFKVEVLIYFRRIQDLVGVLKSENPLLIARVLKIGSWFWEEAFQNVTGDQLVTSLFPHISFNAKVKILNKLSVHLKNPQQADSFFEATEKKYGLYLASKLLPCCSADLISNCIDVNRTVLTPRQLLIIIQKHPQLTEVLLKKAKSRDFDLGSDYKIVLKYLAQRDMLLFLKLYKEYNLFLRLGWRVTDKFVRKNKQDVIKNPKNYYQLLHNKQIAKTLNNDFKELFINLMPESLSQFKTSYAEVFRTIKNLPAKMRDLNLLLTSIERAYGTQLWDHPEYYVTLELLDLIPVNERENKLKAEYRPSSIPEEKWNCYWKTEKSIPYLKKAISLCSDIKKRAELITLLVETCKVNDDKVALANMCKFIVTRHRNDHVSVRLAFLRTLRKSFKLENLEELHWTPINELIQIFSLNDEPFYHESEFLESYIHFCFVNNLPVKEHIIKWLKTSYGTLNIIQQKPEYEKQCLLMIAEIIPELYKDEELNNFNVRFLNSLIHWNKRHPKDEISLFTYPAALESVKRILQQEHSVYTVSSIITSYAHTKIDSEQGRQYLNFFLSKFVDLNIMNWLIRHEPLTVLQNIETVKQLLLEVYYARDDCFFWKRCRYYTHLEIPQKIIKICLNTLEEKQDAEHQNDNVPKKVIAALSYLMTGEEFKQFIVPYYPSGLRVDSKSDEGQKMHKIQKNIGGSLKNLKPSSLALESILVFSKGDYLKMIQSSLYSVAGNVNEDKLPAFFSELSGRAVSTRKHALHLTFRVLDKQHIYSMLNKFMETEKNASIRKFIFKSTFSFFATNPDDYSWELVKVNVNAVDVKDKEALDVLLEVDKIPKKYLVQYILFTWDIVSKLSDTTKEGTESKKTTLLRSIEGDIMQLLPKEFCNAIIEKYFFKCDEGSAITHFQSTVQRFTCRYILYCNSPTEQEERLKVIFAILTDYVKKTWHNSDVNVLARNCVSNFLKLFCYDFLTDKYLDSRILIKFSDLWNGCFKAHEAFQEYLHLQLTFIYIEKLPLPQIGLKLAKLCDSLVSTYGPYVIDMFSKKLIFFTKYFVKGSDNVLEENRYVLIESLVEANSSVGCLILVILLLDQYKATIPKTKVKYMAIVEMLEKKSDPVIQLYLNNHFKDGTLCASDFR